MLFALLECSLCTADAQVASDIDSGSDGLAPIASAGFGNANSTFVLVMVPPPVLAGYSARPPARRRNVMSVSDEVEHDEVGFEGPGLVGFEVAEHVYERQGHAQED